MSEHEWKQYRRKGTSEMRRYVRGEDLAGVSISDPDLISMSADLRSDRDPGGFIARNPKNHADQWYVSQAYFEENLAPADSDPAAELRAALRRCCNLIQDFLDFGIAPVDRGPARHAVEAARAALAATEGSE